MDCINSLQISSMPVGAANGLCVLMMLGVFTYFNAVFWREFDSGFLKVVFKGLELVSSHATRGETCDYQVVFWKPWSLNGGPRFLWDLYIFWIPICDGFVMGAIRYTHHPWWNKRLTCGFDIYIYHSLHRLNM